MEKTKRRFDNYGKQGLLCGSDGLPHLTVSGDQRHWGEFINPAILFLYIAGWIGWVGRSYLIAIRHEKKPTQKGDHYRCPVGFKAPLQRIQLACCRLQSLS